MHEQYIPLETDIGVISGRDALYLDSFEYQPSAGSITLRGGVNGHLCSRNVHNAQWMQYELTLLGVYAFEMIDIDLSNWRGQSSFDEVQNSTWLSQLRTRGGSARVSPRHKHFYVMTYDDVFDIIAKSYQFVATPAQGDQ